MVKLVECLSGINTDLASLPSALQNRYGAIHTCNLSICEMEAGGAEVQNHPWPQTTTALLYFLDGLVC